MSGKQLLILASAYYMVKWEAGQALWVWGTSEQCGDPRHIREGGEVTNDGRGENSGTETLTPWLFWGKSSSNSRTAIVLNIPESTMCD